MTLVVVSGCLSAGSGPGDGTAEPTTVGTPPECTGSETTPDFNFSADLPSKASGFELTVSERTVNRGESISFELTNVANERQVTGVDDRYALQRRVAGGWQTVTLFPPGRSGFNATAIPHSPGDGFTWSFEATAAGFSADKFVVCEQLSAGEYRFIYEASPALAVEFELTDSGR